MRLKSIELSGFKSFAKKTPLQFSSAITAIVGPNGSGKSNIAEAFRFVLGEQSMKSLRSKRGEDLIWNGSGSAPRAGRASVKLVFENPPVGGKRMLSIDFDEVSVERVVNRDGTNNYILNNSPVRLRDVSGLLAQANIGSTGHHIISQGEADRVLSSSSKERREMMEDALGLTSYLYKREEAERKLQKTGENMREVEALRRELGPHLKFLSTQVKKIEESEALRGELKEKYLEYLRRESVYTKATENELKEEFEAPMREREMLDKKVEYLKNELSKKGKDNAGAQEIINLEVQGRRARERRDALAREVGRIEGELAVHERLSSANAPVSADEAKSFAERALSELEEVMRMEGAPLKNRLSALIILVKEFLRRVTAPSARDKEALESLALKKAEFEKGLEEVHKEEAYIGKELQALRRKIENERDASHEAERELFAAMSKRNELEIKLAELRAKESTLAHEKEALRSELAEAGVLLGQDATLYDSWQVVGEKGEVTEAEILEEERSLQAERKRRLERLKIKLEATATSNAKEILKEHEETSERDRFLTRELGDLEVSVKKLHDLIEELTTTLEERFADGIKKINIEFERFFKLMFGGGSAMLSITKEMFGGGSAMLSITKEKKLRRAVGDEEDVEMFDEDGIEVEEGIEISISLPHKRIKGLHMLSGGERALTSIALIFAMSQVNPPPFLILDETDAALDEANSRRYGDMIESLSKRSQLILITHNRETMSRAGVLYGVTMGSDGASKLLSVKFDEALAVAK